MTRSLLFLIAAMLLGAFLPATDSSAAVFSRDWQTPGDGLLTFDDVNQREWLDLTETLLFQFSPFWVEAREVVLSELETNGQYEGFVWATFEDISALGESAGVDTTTTNFAANELPAKQLIQMLGLTAFSPGGATASRGLADNTADPTTLDPIVAIAQSQGDFYAGLGTSPTFGGLDRPGRVHGMWIYRPVPEPSAAALILIGFLGSWRFRYRR